ncbi:helicase associated domain-containing protein [Curtobacterium sp. MCSS17_016]|uniref:helicase associated domain-containing protein n=1 Tax=Curtobacterium sp. MCSS17_016 TaxID=2175644 RepID=UPI000DA78669|nr:helicase associated domain-containing protein [Curtobacterium sp. MCSS17_016]WIE81167.1 helicase associated domain-containing protein [Curtobacterium sp. MCSS17_016]
MSDTTFDHAVNACTAHATREGHLRVPVAHTEAGVQLNAWIRSRRREYRKGAIRADRRAALEAIPHWSWDAPRRQASPNPTQPFRRGVVAVRLHVQQGGPLIDVPPAATVNGVNISRWVARHRALQRKGLLGAKHLDALATIPGWGAGETSSDLRWERGMQHLRVYAAEKGHTRVLNREAADDGFLIGRFVSEARGAHRKGILPEGRVAALEALPGWEWTPKRGRPTVPPR